MIVPPSALEQDTHQQITRAPARHSLAWVLLSTLGSVLAFLVLAGTLAGRAGMPITPALLLSGAALGLLPGIWAIVRGQCETRWPEFTLCLLAFALVAGMGLWLSWPALLPLGRSVDAVHQYQLVRWIAEEQRLPPVDGQTRGLMGEMVAYPTGLAFVVNAAAALASVSPLDALFPTVALLGGLCAALVVQAAVAAANVQGWRVVLPGLFAVVVLLAHRAYFLHAYIDSSYYAQMLGLALALVACCWMVSEPQLNAQSALQLGVVLAALLASYPLWVPVPLVLAVVVLVGRWTVDGGWWLALRLTLVLVPLALIAVLDLPARLSTGQTVLEHEGVVTQPTLWNLMPLVLAVPALAVLFLPRQYKNNQVAEFRRFPPFPLLRNPALPLLAAFVLTVFAVGMLALAAQRGLTAPYHSIKMLFLLVPLAAAVVGAALIRLTILRPLALRWPILIACVFGLWFTSGRFLLPIQAEQIPNRDLLAAAAWLREQDPKAAHRTILVGAPAGPMSYWLQVALLGQRRDQADAATRAFTITPPTPESWAVDTQLPRVVVAANLTEAPPGSVVVSRFGKAAVLERTTLDMNAANPLVLRYSTRWEDERLKTELELIRPVPSPLPQIELRLIKDGHIINTFALQPDAERTKPQYLGADVVPATLGGMGYINSDEYPTFAPPATAPSGSFQLMLRLASNGQTLDERLLATFDRTVEGEFANLSLHSGELDYLRRNYADQAFNNLDTRFAEQLVLAGWKADANTNGTISVLLQWHAQTEIWTSLSPELRLTDAAGNTVARSRSAPQNGFYPTWRWRTSENVTEQRTLQLPPNLPAGTYTLHIAVFDDTTQTELPTKGTTVLGDILVKR